MTGCIAVVGAGQAGLQFSVALRDLGYDGRVVLIGAEPGLPYQRPPLSKGFLSGTETAQDLELRERSFLQERRIELLDGQRVASVDLDDAPDAGRLRLEDGTEIGFDTLCLATGATARRLPLDGADLPGVLSLRDRDDAERLSGALVTATDVVVVGGGFVGLEVAATARAQGRRVTVVEAADRLLARVAAAPISEHVRAWHADSGTTILTGTGVSRLTGTDRVTGVVLDDGRALPADLVVVGIGAEPEVSLARSLGLATERGVVTDEAGRTSHPRVLAVGDCTVQPHPHLVGRLIGIESVNNAVDQATAAAAAALGLDGSGRGVPWFWSHQGELRLQMAGISDGHDRYVLRGDGTDGRLTVLYYRDERLVSADVIGNPRDFNAVRTALAQGLTVDPSAAADVTVSLKSLLTDAAPRHAAAH